MNVSVEELKTYCKTNHVMIPVRSEEDYNEISRFVTKQFPDRRGQLNETYNSFMATAGFVGFDRFPYLCGCDEKGLAYRREHGYKDTITEWADFKTQFAVTEEDCTVTVTIDRVNVYKHFCQMAKPEEIRLVEQYYREQGYTIVPAAEAQDNQQQKTIGKTEANKTNITAETLREYCKTNSVWIGFRNAEEYNEIIRFIVRNYPKASGPLWPSYNASDRYLDISCLPGALGYAREKDREYYTAHGAAYQYVEWPDFKAQFGITADDLTATATIDETNVYQYINELQLRDKVQFVKQYFESQGFTINNLTRYQ